MKMLVVVDGERVQEILRRLLVLHDACRLMGLGSFLVQRLGREVHAFRIETVVLHIGNTYDILQRGSN